MKKIQVETKHGGQITVPVFESLESAIKATSKEVVLKNFNRMTRIDLVNEANREMSVTAQLKKAVKAGKVTEAQLLALLK